MSFNTRAQETELNCTAATCWRGDPPPAAAVVAVVAQRRSAAYLPSRRFGIMAGEERFGGKACFLDPAELVMVRSSAAAPPTHARIRREPEPEQPFCDVHYVPVTSPRRQPRYEGRSEEQQQQQQQPQPQQ
jgi:hypothetical protein